METKDVLKAAAGDREAFGRLYEEYRERLIRFAAKQVGEDNAEDAVSETFLTAFERLGELRDPSAFGSWIYSVCYRKCADQLRREKRSAPGPLDEPVMLPEDYAEQQELISRLREHIDGMKPADRTAVIMYYYEERSAAEVAEALGVSENAAKQRLFQARKKLKKLLASQGEALAAVPVSALLDRTLDGKYAKAAITSAKSGAAAAKSTLAARIVGGAAALAVAVGIPVGILLNSERRTDRLREDSSVVIEERTEELPPQLYDGSFQGWEFVVIPVCAAAFGALVWYAVRSGAVSGKKVRRIGTAAAAAVGLEFAVMSRCHNPFTWITAEIAVSLGADRPIQVQTYPERVYVVPETKTSPYWAARLGMIPCGGDGASVNKCTAYADYDYSVTALDSTVIVGHASPGGEYSAEELIDRSIENSGDNREFDRKDKYITELIEAKVPGDVIIPQLEKLVREGGLKGGIAAHVIERRSCVKYACEDWNADWKTPEEFLARGERFKSGIRDTAQRLDLPLQAGTFGAAAAYLLAKILKKRRRDGTK